MSSNPDTETTNTTPGVEIEQQRAHHLVDQAVQQYLIASDEGDITKQRKIEEAASQDQGIANLFLDRIAQLKKDEEKEISRFKEEIIKEIGSRARQFFGTIAEDRRNPYHVLNPQNFQKYQGELSTILKSATNAKSLSEVSRVNVSLQQWIDNFKASVSNGYRVAENAGGPPQPTDHLRQEMGNARSLINTINERKEAYLQLRQRLRPY